MEYEIDNINWRTVSSLRQRLLHLLDKQVILARQDIIKNFDNRRYDNTESS